MDCSQTVVEVEVSGTSLELVFMLRNVQINLEKHLISWSFGSVFRQAIHRSRAQCKDMNFMYHMCVNTYEHRNRTTFEYFQ